VKVEVIKCKLMSVMILWIPSWTTLRYKYGDVLWSLRLAPGVLRSTSQTYRQREAAPLNFKLGLPLAADALQLTDAIRMLMRTKLRSATASRYFPELI
jgi:hypothetical protein